MCAVAAGSGGSVGFNQPRGSRAMDVALSLIGLIAVSPLLVAACLGILVEDGWPVIHRRKVLGLGGSEFKALKLRTMRADADQWIVQEPALYEQYRAHTKLDKDPRVTRLGRLLRGLHIDELPQLVNVLAGQMSIVGPRMIHPSELARFGSFGTARLSVRPGITGLWQVSKTSYGYDERIALDRFYIENHSLVLDLRIALLTIPSIFGWRTNLLPTPPNRLGGN